MKMIERYIVTIGCIMLLAACRSVDGMDPVTDDADIIRVGSVNTGVMTTKASAESGAQAAETLPWLKEGLAQGMDISYSTKTESRKARLKLEVDGDGNVVTSAGGVTVYSLKAYDSDDNLTAVPAKWLGNGAHRFQGVYIPDGLKEHKAHQEYTDLLHYTAIPPKADIQATVGLITIPLQHRLARVVAYVLIDQSMNAKLKGYDAQNYDADATMLRFCNVKTLDYVSADGEPVWKEERKAVPHFLGEETVRLYKSKSSGKLIFPTDADWQAADADYTAKGSAGSYTCTDYGKVPCYDIIVRPTYTVADYAMYDETVVTHTQDNRIDFELTLDNDLEYEKQFSFDLDANDETVVYLRVTPERVDYKSAGSRLWTESSYNDAYYGVNNENGHRLSIAGGSWQRAYTNGTLNTGVTDGHYYDADTEDTEAQYVSDDKFIAMLNEATTGGAHHGDYFILKDDITIDVNEFDDDFVFTGHLDALDHTITLTGVTAQRDWLFAGLDGAYDTHQESDMTAVWEANVHKENNIWVPTKGWRAETVNVKVTGGSLYKEGAVITGNVSNCWNGTVRIQDSKPSIPEY